MKILETTVITSQVVLLTLKVYGITEVSWWCTLSPVISYGLVTVIFLAILGAMVRYFPGAAQAIALKSRLKKNPQSTRSI